MGDKYLLVEIVATSIISRIVFGSKFTKIHFAAARCEEELKHVNVLFGMSLGVGCGECCVVMQ